MSIRLSLSLSVAKIAGFSSRLVGGKGETLPGRILMYLYPAALKKLSVGRKIILVSGTNGKTSTTRALVGFVRTKGEVVTSESGSNLTRGAATALMNKGDYAVLEVDELHLPIVAAQVNPSVILLLNLSRDQLHRMFEVKRVADKWREMCASTGATVVADIDDPFVNYAVSAAKKSVRVSFGGAAGKHVDGSTCPSCGAYVDWDGGMYVCQCGLTNHSADVVLSGDTAAIRNIELANVAAEQFGIPWHECDVEMLERKVHKKLGNVDASIRLTKNPASWREALRGVRGDQVILILNAREVDGIDTSWLWDVSYASLRGKKVIVCGERGLDLAYRLSVEGVSNECVATFDEALTHFSGSVEVLAAYTAFFKWVNA